MQLNSTSFKLRDLLPRIALYNYVIIVSHDIVHRNQ